MSDEALKIKIGVETKEFVKGWDELQAKLKGLPKATNSAANALQNLSRVAQDAPFGFIGIQNNINPLLESFQRLKAETGSTGSALKAMVSSLSGAAGLGLAVSVVTSLLTAFGGRIFSTKNATDDAAEANKKLAESQQKVADSLGAELGKVERLRGLIIDETNSRKERNEAINELKKINPEYFGQLSTEGNLVAQVNTAYNAYKANLLSVAKAKVLSAKIDEEASKIVALELEKANLAQQVQLTNLAKSDPFLKKSAAGSKVYAQQLALGAAATTRLTEVTKELALSQSKVQGFAQMIGDLNIDNIDLTKTKKDKKVVVEVDEVDLKPATVGILGGRFSKGISGLADVTKGLPKIKFTDLFSFDANTLQGVVALNSGLTDLAVTNKNLQGSLKVPDSMNATFVLAAQNAEKLAATLTATLGPAFQDLFATIISGGQNALAHFGEAIKQIITKLISAAITAAIFAAIISIAFPNAAAGGANFGKNFSNIFAAMGGIPKRASGGVVTSKQLNIVGEAGPEAIIPLNKLPGLIAQMQPVSASNLNIVGQIRGNDIVLVNKRSGGQYGNTLSF